MNQTISVKDIEPNPFQSRKQVDRDAVEALAQSIKQAGFWETALRVRKHNGAYQLVWGHQRLEALRKLGHKEVPVEVVELDDLRMAEESLIENLQRTGLYEIDKAEAIARVLNMLMTTGRSTSSRNKAIDQICSLLGYQSPRTIEEYLAMAEMSAPTKAVLRENNTVRGAVRIARHIGGEKMVQHAAREKISQRDLEPMMSELKDLPKESRAKVVEKIIERKVTQPQEVKQLARREQARIVKKHEIPPDLMIFIDWWVLSLDNWTDKLKAAAKHRAYIHEHPETVTKFKDAAERFIAALKDLIDLR